jgi:hypothetical protein
MNDTFGVSFEGKSTESSAMSSDEEKSAYASNSGEYFI